MDTVSIEPRMLYSQLGSPEAPLVVDVRREPAYEEDPHLIAGAVRPEGDLLAFVERHAQGRRVVAYCVKGAEVGIGAASMLAAAGHRASYLAGGLRDWRTRNAVAYDIAGAPATHRGERCSFDALIAVFGLHDPALDRLALIVRGADGLYAWCHAEVAGVHEEHSWKV